MWLGISAGLLACALWGVTYLLPYLLPTYSPAQSGLGRCVILGAFSCCLLFTVYRKKIKELSTKDWIIASKLAMVGMLINFVAMLYCCAWAGASVAGLTTGAIPVCVAIIANERDKKIGRPAVNLTRLIFPLALICIGFILCNISEFKNIDASETLKFFIGVALGITHTALWTWYPIVNADWLLEHPKFDSFIWATAQCASLLPAGIITYLVYWYFFLPGTPIVGDQPVRFFVILLLNGVFCCWGAAGLWNYLCQKVPTSLAGQIMVFETIFTIMYAHIFDARFPSWEMVLGSALLIFGVVYSLQLFQKAIDAKSAKKSAN